MTGDQTMRVIYLVLLGVVIAGYAFVQSRGRIGHTLQQAALWGFIFLGVVVAFGLWSDIRRTALLAPTITAGGGRIEAPRHADGHYYLTLGVNGVPVKFMVDTGASDIVLSQRDARRVGIDPSALSYYGSASTANGMVRTAPVRLATLSLGGVSNHDVRAWVNNGQMDGSLLGMAYLQRFRSVQISAGKLVLTR